MKKSCEDWDGPIMDTVKFEQIKWLMFKQKTDFPIVYDIAGTLAQQLAVPLRMCANLLQDK